LTMVHVKADITYNSFDEGEKIVHLNDIFENYYYLLDELSCMNKDIHYSNLKARWQKTEEMDIGKMNALTEVLLVEHYLKYGLTKFNDEYKMNRCAEHKSYQKFLDEQTSLEDYISVLNNLLVDSNKEEIGARFLELKEMKENNTEDFFKEFIDNYLGSGYEVGKVYLVEVNKEHYMVDNETDVSEVEFLNSGAYLDLKREILDKDDFNYVILRDIPMNGKRSGKKSYLLDNVHEKDGEKLIHGWVGDILPVRVIGFHKDGTPITQYAKEWFSV